MPSRYAEAHLNAAGAGDARPTVLDIIKDEGLEGKLTGKVFFITGCASGISIETARALSATGATLYLTVRNTENGRSALADILEPGRVELMEMDQNSLDGVRACAKKFL
jgi:NAD(P)-dependent dehydrogenase (short-subunit alcohol dehydrogenase family)